MNEMHDENDHEEKQHNAYMEDYLRDSLGDYLSDILGDNQSEPEPTTQSELASMRKMIEEQRDMLNNAFQQNTQLRAQNAELMEANREYHRESILPEPRKMKIFNMTNLERYCGGAMEFDSLLDMLRSNFEYHAHLFPHGDPDTVKYVASLHSSWND